MRRGNRQPGEHDDPLRGAEGRMARREHEAVAAALGDPDGGRIDDAGRFDAVGEAPVRHRQHDRVPALELVDLGERGQIGRAVAGQSHGPAQAGQPGPRVVAGAAAQRVRVGPLGDDVRPVQRRHRHTAERIARVESSCELARRAGQRPPLTRSPCCRHVHRAAEPLRLRAEVALERVLVTGGKEGGDRLVPDQRDSDIEQQQGAAHRQDRADESQRGAPAAAPGLSRRS